MARPRTLFGGSSPGGKGGGGRPTTLFGDGARAPRLTPQQRANAKLDNQSGHGFIGKIANETGHLVTGLPTSTAHLGKDLGVEAAHAGKAVVAPIIAGPLHGFKPGSTSGAVKESAPRLTGYGAGKAIVAATQDPNGPVDSEYPLISGIAQSGTRTAGRLTHPGRYLEAYRQGHLVGSVVEDLGNLAIVGGAGAKALDAGTAGALSEAEGARTAAATLTERTIPAAEKELAAQEQRLAATQDLINAGGQGTQDYARLYTDYEGAKGVRDQMAQALDEQRATAARESARADELLSGRNAAVVRAHRIASAIERFGAKGANAPATPFVVTGKVLGKAVETLFKVTPGLDKVLANVTDWIAIRDANAELKARVKAAAGTPAAEADARALRISDAVQEMAQTLGDDDLFHAAIMDMQGATPLLGDGIDRIRRAPGGDAVADEALAGMAQHPEFQANARAQELAGKIGTGALDPATMDKVRRAQEILRAKVLKEEQARYLAGEGGSEALNEGQQAERQWQVHSNEANPAGRQALEARHAAERGDAEGQVTQREEAVAKAQERIKLNPEVMADLPEAIRRNADLAAEHARGLVDQAFTAAQSGDTALLDELRAIPGVKGETPEELTQSLYRKIEQAAGSLKLTRQHPILRQAVEETGMERIKVPGRGATRKLEKAAAKAGEAQAAATHAKRLAATEERLRNAGPAAVKRVVKAVENLAGAKARVEAKLAKAAEARKTIAGANRVPEEPTGKAYDALRDEVTATRQSIVDAARTEAEVLDEHLPTNLPYVPGGMSEHYDALVDRLGGRDWSIGDEMERYRTDNPHSRLSDEAVFKRLYAGHWQSLPTLAKETLERLSDQDLSALYQRWRRGQVTPDLFSLDEHVATFAGDAAAGSGREAAYSDFLDAMERRAGLRRIVKSGPRGGFYPEDLQRFYAAIQDPEVRALASDETMRAILERGRSASAVDSATRSLWESRLAEQASGPGLPNAQRLADLYGDENISLENVLHRAYGDQALADEALSRWMRAGEPDLDASIQQMIRGETPDWLQGQAGIEGARAVQQAERRAGAANRLDQADEAFRYPKPGERPGRSKLTPEEAALAEAQVAPSSLVGPQRAVERAVATSGGSETVGRLSAAAQAQAERAQAAAQAADLEGARTEATAGGLTKPVVKQITDYGGQVRKYQDALRDLKFSQQRLARLSDRQAQELVDYSNEIKNASARWRAPLQQLNAAGDVIGEIAKQLEDSGADPALLDVLNDVQRDWTVTLADLTREGHFVAGPGGESVPMEPAIHPEYVPGGRLTPKTTGQEPYAGPGPKVRLSKSAAERNRKTAVVASTPKEFHDVLVQRARREGMNEVAHSLNAHMGVRPAQVIGEERAQGLAEPIREAQRRQEQRIAAERAKVKAMEKGEAKSLARVQLKEKIARIKRETALEKREAARTLMSEMAEKGYQPWDPRKLYPSAQNPDGIGTVIITDPDQLSTSTQWMPKGAPKIFDDMYRGPGGVERAMRKTWDPATNLWKAAVLPLSPRWQVGNAVGNFVMATLGGGIDPVSWARSMRDATSVLRQERLTPKVENPEAFGLSERQTARATRKLGKAEARVAQLDPAVLESIKGRNGEVHLDPHLMQQGGMAGHDPYITDKVTERGRVRQVAHTIIQKSYAANSFVDNLNRVAVYLEKHRGIGSAELAEFRARNPHLSSTMTDAEMRDAAAVQLSLDAVGDFQNLTRTERQVIRRVVPFYSWLKHITRLAFRLPVTNPMRVIWMLHVADMYGTNDSSLPAWLGGSLRQDDNTFWHLPRINPLEDVVALPASGKPRDIVKAGLGSVGPIPRLAAAGLLGYDTRTGLPIRRPPGAGVLDESGNPTIDPLLFRDPRKLGQFLLGQTPETSIGRAAYDQAAHGKPLLRYPTGEPYRSSTTGQTYPGTPLAGQLAGWAGLPYKENVDVARIQASTQAKIARNEKAKQGQKRRPAATSGRPSTLFGG